MHNQESKEEKKPLKKKELKSVISQLYKPAKNFQEADETLTTQELMEQLQESLVGEIDPEEFHSTMKQLGFEQEPTAGSVEWLLKKK